MWPKTALKEAPDLRMSEAIKLGVLTDPILIREQVAHEMPICPLCGARVAVNQWNAHQAQEHAKNPVRIDANPDQFPMGAISANELAQPRLGLDTETVERYAEAIRDGAVLPPVVLFYDAEKGMYYLADGFHRRAAFRVLGRTTINVVIRKGTLRDAILHSVGANAEHGLPRSNEDKRRAVMRLLTDPEWAQWSNVTIAETCRVNEKTVRNYRKSIFGNSEDSAPADTTPTMTTPAAPRFPQPPAVPVSRMVTRGETTYPMNTGNIGKSAAPRTQVRADEFSQRAPDDDAPLVDADADEGVYPPFDDTPDLPPAVPKAATLSSLTEQERRDEFARQWNVMHPPPPLPAPVPLTEHPSVSGHAAALAARQTALTAQPSAAVSATEDGDSRADVMVCRDAIIRMIDKVESAFGISTAQKQVIIGIGRDALKKTDHR